MSFPKLYFMLLLKKVSLNISGFLSADKFSLMSLKIQAVLNNGEVHFHLWDSYWPLRRKIRGQGGKHCLVFMEGTHKNPGL